ncbi:hypothetical protein K458DRAFT_353551, partial [Lentithecium fluviatile CBS 122367]
MTVVPRIDSHIVSCWCYSDYFLHRSDATVRRNYVCRVSRHLVLSGDTALELVEKFYLYSL